MTQASSPILRLTFPGMPAVRPMKMGPSPTGSITTNKVTSAETRAVLMQNLGPTPQKLPPNGQRHGH